MIETFGAEMSELIESCNLLKMSEKTIAACERWDNLCHRLFHTYQDVALQEVEASA